MDSQRYARQLRARLENLALVRRAFDEAEGNPDWRPFVGDDAEHWLWWPLGNVAGPGDCCAPLLDLFFDDEDRVTAGTGWRLGIQDGVPFFEWPHEGDRRFRLRLHGGLARRARALRDRALRDAD